MEGSVAGTHPRRGWRPSCCLLLDQEMHKELVYRCDLEEPLANKTRSGGLSRKARDFLSEMTHLPPCDNPGTRQNSGYW